MNSAQQPLAATRDLSLFDQQVLLAVMRLHPYAYGVNICEEILNRSGKDQNTGTVYRLLHLMETEGLVTSRKGEATKKRGGRFKSYFTITETGKAMLRESLDAIDRLRDGVVFEGIGQ
jgi:DNA-binding PadR family transcriptional regulator